MLASVPIYNAQCMLLPVSSPVVSTCCSLDWFAIGKTNRYVQTWPTSTFITFWCRTVFAASLTVFYYAILDNETYFDNIFHPKFIGFYTHRKRPKTNKEKTGGNGTRSLTQPCKLCTKHAHAPDSDDRTCWSCLSSCLSSMHVLPVQDTTSRNNRRCHR